MNEQPKQENKAMACLRCGGEMVEREISASGPHYLLIRPLDHKFFDSRASNITAFVCNVCGYTELYATDIAEIEPKQQ